jgi:hypothetical protein
MDDFHIFEQHRKSEGKKNLHLIILGQLKINEFLKIEYKFYI